MHVACRARSRAGWAPCPGRHAGAVDAIQASTGDPTQALSSEKCHRHPLPARLTSISGRFAACSTLAVPSTGRRLVIRSAAVRQCRVKGLRSVLRVYLSAAAFSRWLGLPGRRGSAARARSSGRGMAVVARSSLGLCQGVLAFRGLIKHAVGVRPRESDVVALHRWLWSGVGESSVGPGF